MNPRKSWFVSDLHLFARRSSAPDHEPSIRAAVLEADTFVLGGDIFDFRWSPFRTMEEAVRESIAWLNALMELNSDCRFHYLLGNHDSHPQFVEALRDRAESDSRLQWHRHYMRLGDQVYLHGDIVDSPVPRDQIHHDYLDARRLAKDERERPHRLSHVLYDAAVRARVHRAVLTVAKRPQLVLRRLSRYLESQGETAANGVRHVYFGHTHRPMFATPYQGMLFHNPGAAIKGLPFRLIETGVGDPAPAALNGRSGPGAQP